MPSIATHPVLVVPARSPQTGAGAAADGKQIPTPRRVYLAVLTWAFTVFSSLRVVAYLPTIWAIHASGDSSQHSLWTWITWLGANATMAAWLHETNGQRVNRAVIVNTCNAAMCLVVVVLILGHRL
jgi:hypothetical protein